MIKRLIRSVREYKYSAILSPLCMIGEVSMEILIPLVIFTLTRAKLLPQRYSKELSNE